MRGGEVGDGLRFHADGNHANGNGGIRFGVEHDELPAHFFEEVSVVFHQAVTGVDVSAGGDGADAVNFGEGCFSGHLFDWHERPAGEHALPFFGETRQIVLLLSVAHPVGEVCEAAQEEIGDRFQFGNTRENCAEPDQGIEDTDLLLAFCFTWVGWHFEIL